MEKPDESAYQYVPYEQRKSQNPSPGKYLYQVVETLAVTKLSGLAGWYAGKKLAAKGNHSWFANPAVLGFITGAIGGLFEGYRHWFKTENKREQILEVQQKAKAVVDPTVAESQAAIQATIEKKLERIGSFAEKLRNSPDTFAKRFEDSAEQPAKTR